MDFLLGASPETHMRSWLLLALYLLYLSVPFHFILFNLRGLLSTCASPHPYSLIPTPSLISSTVSSLHWLLSLSPASLTLLSHCPLSLPLIVFLLLQPSLLPLSPSPLSITLTYHGLASAIISVLAHLCIRKTSLQLSTRVFKDTLETIRILARQNI